MWKKKLILIVTFVAGLYYFLEFAVPPIMPGQGTSGIVTSVVSITDMDTMASDVMLELTTFKRTVKMPVTDKLMVDWIKGDQTKRIATSDIELSTTSIIAMDNSERGIICRKNKAELTIGILGGTKTINAKVENGKSKTVSFRMENSGGESQIDDPGSLLVGDLVSQIGPTTYVSSILTDVSNGLIVLATMAWGFALFSLWIMHSSAIRKKTKEWYMSVLFFAGLVFGIFAGIGYGAEPDTNYHKILLLLNDTVAQYIQFAFYSATFSLLSFYLASAAYRSFKAKSREAVLMMVSALIVMLGQIPFGVYLTSWIPGQTGLVPAISRWLQLVLNTASQRGMWFGIMLASMAIGLRYWLSLERGAFFDREL
ncbi:MAG: hypothetical protein NT018_05675 [Armatimonadetes bacterium]|nr:hypothetical protein [Armatimonadota bacterium]